MSEQLIEGSRVVYDPQENKKFWEFRIGLEGTVTHIDLTQDAECCSVQFDGEDHPVRAYIHNLRRIE